MAPSGQGGFQRGTVVGSLRKIKKAGGGAIGIDTVSKFEMTHPLGPPAEDLIDLDTPLSILEVLHRALGDSKYRPSSLLRRIVDAGRLGRKRGEGFFTHSGVE